MSFTSDILLVFFIGLFATANNVDLNTNTTFLFLLLLILSLNTQVQHCCRDNRPCPLSGLNNFNNFNNGFPPVF